MVGGATGQLNKKIMKNLILTLGLVGACALAPATSALAQPARGANAAQGGGGVFALPQGVKRVVSIDAYNMLMVEVDRDGKSAYVGMPARHVYSGGLARLFGGTVVPTADFVSPGAGGNGQGGMGRGGAGGGNIGLTGVGGGFGGGGFGGGNQGFGNAGGGIGGVLGGGGFGAGNLVNRQIVPSLGAIAVNPQVNP